MTKYYRNMFIYTLIATIVCVVISVISIFIITIPPICPVAAAALGVLFADIADKNYNEYMFWKKLDQECEEEEENNART